MCNTIPYIPNIDNIIATARILHGHQINEIITVDDYVDWTLNVLFEVEDGVLYLSSNCQFVLLENNEDVRRQLWDVILVNIDVCQRILPVVENASFDELCVKTKEICSTQDLRVVLAWMERANVVTLKNGRYVFVDSDPEGSSAFFGDEIQTFSSIDVKESKFSIFDYLRKVGKNQILLNPDFQRNEVWTIEQNSRFIESVILNIPIPPIYLKENQQGKKIVVDGLQRTTALISFFKGEYQLTGLHVCPNLNGLTVNDITHNPDLSHLLTKIEDKQLNFYILPLSTPMAVVYDIFNRINTGGTNLSTQEIRNCVLIGHSTIILKALATNAVINDAIDYGIKDKRMKLREAILRCLAFVVLDYQKLYRNSMNGFLEQSMIVINKMSNTEIDQLKEVCVETFAETLRVFGNRNFRIPTPYTRGRLNIAVMETVFYCFFNLRNKNINKTDEELRKNFDLMLNDASYIDAVRNSTSSTLKVKNRFELASKYFGL